jgi:MFS transporter, DHA2 family, multidrug resistance protein
MRQPAPDSAVASNRRWVILGVLVLSLLVVVLDTSILNVALKTLAEPGPKGLGASQSELEWATNAYTLAFAGLLLTWGILGDRLGRKRVLLAGMVAFGLSSLLCAYADSPGELIAFRALMGISGAAVIPSTLSIIANVFEPHERAKAIGIWAGAVGLALSIGPITGGLLLEHFWWGSVFLVNVPIVVVALIAMVRLVPESRNPHPGRLDPLGLILSIAGIIVFVLGIVDGGDGSFTSAAVIAELAAGVALLVAFIAWERRAPSPVLNVALFARSQFSAAVGIITITFFAYMGLFFALSFYFQSARGLSPLQTGLSLLPLAAGQLIFSSRSAGFVQRFGARPVVATGLALMTVAFAYDAVASATSSVVPLEFVLFLQGMGVGFVMPPVTSAIMGSVPRAKAGEGSAIGNTARQVGGALGVAILGAVMSSAYRKGIDPHLAAVTHGAGHRGLLSAVDGSLTATLAFAARTGAAGHALVAPAIAAFVHAMHEAALGAAALAMLGAVIALRWLPGRAASASGVETASIDVDGPALVEV